MSKSPLTDELGSDIRTAPLWRWIPVSICLLMTAAALIHFWFPSPTQLIASMPLSLWLEHTLIRLSRLCYDTLGALAPLLTLLLARIFLRPDFYRSQSPVLLRYILPGWLTLSLWLAALGALVGTALPLGGLLGQGLWAFLFSPYPLWLAVPLLIALTLLELHVLMRIHLPWRRMITGLWDKIKPGQGGRIERGGDHVVEKLRQWDNDRQEKKPRPLMPFVRAAQTILNTLQRNGVEAELDRFPLIPAEKESLAALFPNRTKFDRDLVEDLVAGVLWSRSHQKTEPPHPSPLTESTPLAAPIPEPAPSAPAALPSPVTAHPDPRPSNTDKPNRHRAFGEHETGITFDDLFGEYLRNARKITVTDPYICLFHQIRNMMEFLETVIKFKDPTQPVGVHLVTCPDPYNPEKQADNLNKIITSVESCGVTFTWAWDESQTLHARHIVIDDRWKISLDRGLDIFRYFEKNDAFALSNRLQQVRPCKAFEVTYIKL